MYKRQDLNPTSQTTGGFTTAGVQSVYNITGTDLSDILTSSTGTEIFRGGTGADHFVFADANGQDQIRDFTAGSGGDVITLYLGAGDADSNGDGRGGDGINATGIDTVAELLARCSDQAGNTKVDLGGGNSILLTDVSVSTLIAANFEVVHNYY